MHSQGISLIILPSPVRKSSVAHSARPKSKIVDSVFSTCIAKESTSNWVDMAFLAHSIPWHAVSSMIEVINPKCHKVRCPELAIKAETDHRKQLEFFAAQFQKVIREHSAIDRKRLCSAQEYKDQAQEWCTTQDLDTTGDRSNLPNAADHEEVAGVQTLLEYNAELRQQISMRPRISPIKNRRVFPDDFATTYMSYVPITSGTAYGREGLVEEFASIEAWVDVLVRDEANYDYYGGQRKEAERIWLDRKSCSDIVRLLIIDAASTEDTAKKSHMIDTIFLLAHHPQVGLKFVLCEGMDCCNASVGLSNLVEKVASAFVYLNLL